MSRTAALTRRRAIGELSAASAIPDTALARRGRRLGTVCEDSAKPAGGRDESVLYGYIAWQISKLHRGSEFFAQNRVSWDRVKQGSSTAKRCTASAFEI